MPAALRALLAGTEAVDALWLPPDPLLLGDETRRFLLSETLKAGKPVYSFSAALVARGRSSATGRTSPPSASRWRELVNRLAAGDRRARGEHAGAPRRSCVINKKIADKLRIEIPADALKAASRVF